MLVSQSLHDLAAANLYRYVVYRFSGIIPSHVRDYQLPANEFTDLLETLATSDFNYAANIKTIDLAVGRGDEASWTRTQEGLAYQFKNNTTNGRLLNALILATVKRITALDLLRSVNSILGTRLQL